MFGIMYFWLQVFTLAGCKGNKLFCFQAGLPVSYSFMTHHTYMQRCIQLARLGAGYTAPNPLVGCVVVNNNLVIGEGFHQVFGGPHAEVNAILSVGKKEQLKSSTLYVNLEPCAHFGKTPPCVDLIIKHKIPRVVIGCRDPFVEVNGKGMERLQEAQVEVITGILEQEAIDLNKRFLTFHQKKRPWILLKWAKSTDGFIGWTDKRIPISNDLTNMAVHQWRSEESAIMVGTNTVLVDNPSLTVRNWFGANPVRVILDQHLRLEHSLSVFNDQAKTIVINAHEESVEDHISKYKIDFSNNVLHQVFQRLYDEKIQSVLVEGGATLLNEMISKNLWDEAIVITGQVSLLHGVRSPVLPVAPCWKEKIDNNIMEVYKNVAQDRI